MGFVLSWIAVRGKPGRTVLQELGFTATGAHEDGPGGSPLVAGELASGWYLLIANRADRVAADPSVARVSRGCEVVACTVEERVMYSAAESWRDGRQLWRVVHDSRQGTSHLATGGALPAELSAIRDDLLSQQRGERGDVDHVFDAPIDLARSLTGFRHDESDEDVRFEVLQRGAAPDDVGQSEKDALPPLSLVELPAEPRADDGFVPVRAGDRVVHPTFGAGTVAEVMGSGPFRRARVGFDRVGSKSLVLKYAKLALESSSSAG